MATAAVAIHQFAECITCHAWSPDQSMIAFCPNNNEVHIYKFFTDKWEKLHVLSKHDQIVSGIDWSRSSNKIVTVSHDRNSYVWTQEGSDWVPTLVILKLNRAALCVQWSPKENKFAVGSGAKSVCICYYEQENNWWISKVIRKRHESSVTSLAWHPNNIYLATTSTDGKCRVFSTFIKGVDTRVSQSNTLANSKFGEQIAQLDLSSTWTFGVKWSPSGKTLAYAGHNSMIYFIDDVETSPAAQNLALRDLPLRDVLFASECMLIGVGFDCNPMIFAADETGLWSFVRFLDERKVTPSTSKASQLSEALGKLYGQSKQGTSDTVEPTKPRGGAHENCITCIVPLQKGSQSTIKRFSTSGLDGKIVLWDLENHITIAK
ncbi:actin-related protein 2/3 complex subunit 1B-like [Phragmites australis]|uniref:actin-related protein 2/3 complex subunit 1B-like n=1 Tax=Phragmites australis TaxID=29695 RepID=UPI002D774518|nr:actin-related protein 2/3 complex subunit 1B-like [Phragmites australis]